MTNENATTAIDSAKPAPAKTAPVKVEVSKPQVVTSKRVTAKKAVVKKAVVKKAAPAQAPIAAVDASKTKLVRDSFTMPQHDFALIAALKDRALGFKRATKKSELLRAGLHALQQLSDAQLRTALNALTPLKAGRPKKKA